MPVPLAREASSPVDTAALHATSHQVITTFTGGQSSGDLSLTIGTSTHPRGETLNQKAEPSTGL